MQKIYRSTNLNFSISRTVAAITAILEPEKSGAIPEVPSMVADANVWKTRRQSVRHRTGSVDRRRTAFFRAVSIRNSALGCYVEYKRLVAYARTQSRDRGRPESPGND
jgi:hypothetical protein